MEKRRDRLERIAQEHLDKVKLGDDVSIEVGGPSTQITMTAAGPDIGVGFCFLLSLGHKLLAPPIVAPGVIGSVEIPDAQVSSMVDQLLEAARALRVKLETPGKAEGAILEELRKNPVKLG